MVSFVFLPQLRLEAESPEDLAAATKQSELLAAQAKQARAAVAAAKERQERMDAGTPRQQQISSRLGRTDSADSLPGGHLATPTPGDQPAQPGGAKGAMLAAQLQCICCWVLVHMTCKCCSGDTDSRQEGPEASVA